MDENYFQIAKNRIENATQNRQIEIKWDEKE